MPVWDRAEAELKPDVVAWYAKRARRDNCAVIFAHSHPGANRRGSPLRMTAARSASPPFSPFERLGAVTAHLL